ncbi:uncharacterized protein [Oscarella lobularis]|uniref:uncharacterized protein n=1 Tax=Oscarella lobularis TaxID=121494 RepID=UPI0033138A79
MLNVLVVFYWIAVNGATLFALLSYATGRFQFEIIRNVHEYGKLYHVVQSKEKTVASYLSRLRVPKSWFSHFYAFAILTFVGILLETRYHVIVPFPPPPPTSSPLLLSNWFGHLTSSEVSLCLVLMLIQVTRRFYETVYISIFSPKAKIHIAAYLVGIAHYQGIGLSLALESYAAKPSIFDLKWFQWAAVLLFIWASYHQHATFRILASLRRNSSDATGYYIPTGDWFRYVSCPHYLAELLIYTALITIARGSSIVLWLVYGFVLANQTLCAMQSHAWYRINKKCTPAKYCLIPYIL